MREWHSNCLIITVSLRDAFFRAGPQQSKTGIKH
jgi:hypothetical protein